MYTLYIHVIIFNIFCLSSDFDKILTGIGYNFALLFQWLSTFFTGFIVGFVRDWRLTLLLIALTPFLAIGGMLITWVSTVHYCYTNC